MKNPWYKTTFQLDHQSHRLRLQVPHDVFSTQRIDEGTLLLLEHLPARMPKRVLDMGCGYGALGLPVAARFPDAKVEMVDRDLLAVSWSALNAGENALSNVDAYGSLGYRDLKHREEGYDWILCNVPARIGQPFIQNLMEEGCTRLNENGELRVVVITDLGPILEEMAKSRHWSLTKVGQGPRHVVYSMGKSSLPFQSLSSEELYFRDQVKVEDLLLDRPFDLGGDDGKRLLFGLPVLFDAFPRQVAPHSIMCFRAGYGQVPLVCAKRWPQAKLVAVERDLLALAFTLSNAQRLNLNKNLELRASSNMDEAFAKDECFDLILGELSPSAGVAVASSEIKSLSGHLAPQGQAIILCLEKLEKEWAKSIALHSGLRSQTLFKRDGYAAIRYSH